MPTLRTNAVPNTDFPGYPVGRSTQDVATVELLPHSDPARSPDTLLTRGLRAILGRSDDMPSAADFQTASGLTRLERVRMEPSVSIHGCSRR